MAYKEYTETLLPNSKTWLVNEIIKLRELKNIPLDPKVSKEYRTIRVWLFTHRFSELLDMRIELLKNKGIV